MKSFLLGEEAEVTGAGTPAPVRMQVPAQDVGGQAFPSVPAFGGESPAREAYSGARPVGQCTALPGPDLKLSFQKEVEKHPRR